MTTYPLPTLAVTITQAGITAPSYNDILLSLQASYSMIYGSDISLDPSTQDGAWLAIQASAINDTNQTAIDSYNSFSPATAQGAALSSVVKVNGISRLSPSFSTAAVTLVGQANTPISNGVVGDSAGFNTRWNLPSSVTIPLSGSITVTATCTTPGTITAAANTLTVILTPTANWQSVTNSIDAAPGAPVETDAALRNRQAASTALPSQTTVAGIYGAISNLPGVTNVSFSNNTTNVTNSDGVPGHTLSMVVQGGNLQSIINVIGKQLSVGCGTYGNTSGIYTDPNYGFLDTVYFSIPVQLSIYITVTLTPLLGYNGVVGAEIQMAVAGYIENLGIGQNVLLTRVYAPALLQGPYASPVNPNDPNTYEITSITLGAQASFIGTISGTVLTVTQILSGTVQFGATLSGSGVTLGTIILTGGSGVGGIGTYNLSLSSTVSSAETLKSLLMGSVDISVAYDHIAVCVSTNVLIVT